MNELPHLQEVFDRLRRGWHLSPDDEPAFSAVAMQPDAYAGTSRHLALSWCDTRVTSSTSSQNREKQLPNFASYRGVFIHLIHYAADQGRPIEEYLLGQHFLVSQLPH